LGEGRICARWKVLILVYGALGWVLVLVFVLRVWRGGWRREGGGWWVEKGIRVCKAIEI